MKEYIINVNELSFYTKILSAGDKIYLSGTVYTARDAGDKRIFEMLEKGETLPFEIKDSVIYFAGPSPSKADGTIGSFGPTTSSRMDAFSPLLLHRALPEQRFYFPYTF